VSHWFGLRPLSSFTNALVVRGHFNAISTNAHAAPPTAVILASVVEEKDAHRVLTFLDECQIGVAKKIRSRLCHGPKQLGGFQKIGMKVFLEPTSCPLQLGMPGLMRQRLVNRIDRSLRDGLSFRQAFRHLSQTRSQRQCVLKGALRLAAALPGSENV